MGDFADFADFAGFCGFCWILRILRILLDLADLHLFFTLTKTPNLSSTHHGTVTLGDMRIDLGIVIRSMRPSAISDPISNIDTTLNIA